MVVKFKIISPYIIVLQLIGQYPPPPPVATGPGLDRPLYIPTPDYTLGEGYTMNRTRLFYQDQLDAEGQTSGPTAFIFPDPSSTSASVSGSQHPGQTPNTGSSGRGERRISGDRTSFGGSHESPRRLDQNDPNRW